jgi:hypothetical protein
MVDLIEFLFLLLGAGGAVWWFLRSISDRL